VSSFASGLWAEVRSHFSGPLLSIFSPIFSPITSPPLPQFLIFWQPPAPHPGATAPWVARIIIGVSQALEREDPEARPRRRREILSAVGFGALARCLSQGRSPSFDTSAKVARAIVEGHTERLVHRGPREKNVLRSASVSRSQPASVAASAYRCKRRGGAFGKLRNVS
jgi:hypothetical protein